MMKIKFTSDTNPKIQGGDFKKGATLECSPATGHHWIRRGVAVEVVGKPALKVGRPMMAETRKYKASEVVDVMSVSGADEKAAAEKPKKVGRPKKRA